MNIFHLHYFSFVILFLSQISKICNGFTCVKINSCKCRLDDDTVLDLSQLGSQNGEPRFKNIPDAGAGDLWSYNPCYSFTQNTCKDAASCQIRNGKGFTAGTQESAKFQYDETNGMALVYSATDLGIKRTTYVYLQCDRNENGSLSVLGELTPDGNYIMYLSSKYACPSEDTSSSKGFKHFAVFEKIGLIVMMLYFIL